MTTNGTRALALAATLAVLPVAGCGTDSTTQRATTGAGLGAAGGALIGSLTGDAGWGALIGGGAGALGGYLYDQHQRDRAREAYYDDRRPVRGARYYDRRTGRYYTR